ncbi:MAG: HD domain-containing phosphohydrolase, partial [Bdellovibrionota bacterium]
SDPNSSAVTPIEDIRMLGVSKDFFFDGMQLPASIFLRMKKDTFLLIGKRGDKVNFTELHSFRSPGTVVFVKKDEHTALMQYITLVTEKMVNQKNLPPAIKGKFISGLMDSAVKTFDGKGFANVAQLERVSAMILAVGESLSQFDQVMEMLNSLPTGEAKHSMSTCLVSLMLAEEMELSHKASQEKLTMGALLHDIGLRHVPPEILNKPKHLWTPDDQKTFEMHPLKSVEMLRDIRDISNDVLLIVAEHHENSLGTGFPKRLRDVKLSPLGKIVALANCFSDLLFHRTAEGKDYTADEAISYIEDILGQPYNKAAFLALKNIINKKHLADKT